MSSEERRKILQMVEEGRLSAEEAASLMQALEADADKAEAEVEVFQSESSSGFEGPAPSAPEFDEVRARARNLAMIPLWTGIVIAVLSAWGIYSIQQSAGMNFWFYCLIFPLLLGVLLIALGAGGPGSKWLYVNVDRRRSHDGPRNITLGFPLPLGLTSWFLRNFGHTIQGLRNTNVDEIIQVLDATGRTNEPLIVNVQDDEGEGERVQVYIG